MLVIRLIVRFTSMVILIRRAHATTRLINIKRSRDSHSMINVHRKNNINRKSNRNMSSKSNVNTNSNDRVNIDGNNTSTIMM